MNEYNRLSLQNSQNFNYQYEKLLKLYAYKNILNSSDECNVHKYLITITTHLTFCHPFLQPTFEMWNWNLQNGGDNSDNIL